MTAAKVRAALDRLNVMHQAAILAKHEEPARQQWLREDAAALSELTALEECAEAARAAEQLLDGLAGSIGDPEEWQPEYMSNYAETAADQAMKIRAALARLGQAAETRRT